MLQESSELVCICSWPLSVQFVFRNIVWFYLATSLLLYLIPFPSITLSPRYIITLKGFPDEIMSKFINYILINPIFYLCSKNGRTKYV
jgi:hypothetical protein